MNLSHWDPERKFNRNYEQVDPQQSKPMENSEIIWELFKSSETFVAIEKTI